MAIHADDQGRRSVQVQVEVPGTPEDVWQTIATAAGITSWFVPTTTEFAEGGVPARMSCNFGPGMESVSAITDWDPPRSFFAVSHDLGEEAPVVTTQWIVEPHGDQHCIVRVVHSLFAAIDEWDAQLEGWESGWPSFFRLLRLYQTHFLGQASAQIQLSGSASLPKEAAWSAVQDALGAAFPGVGQPVESSNLSPRLAGVVAYLGGPDYPEEVLLRLETPTTGIAHLFAMEMGEQVLLSVRFYLYGEDAETIRQRVEPEWQAWQKRCFPET